MVFEDAHWSDPTSRELLELTVERVQALAVFVVITYRPEFAPPWSGRPHVMTHLLNRLTRREGSAIVNAVAAGNTLPAEVIDQIVTRTDGVPLFIEELTKTVLESAIPHNENGQARSAASLPALEIPTTLIASLMARLDRLGSARAIAEVGAAIGREFSHELIRAVSVLPAGELDAALAKLVASELVFRRGTPPDAVYTFKHALVQDAAYSTLLRGPRQQLHARIAAVLEAQFVEIVEAQPQLLAHHCTQAGLIDKAIGHFQIAGRQAVTRAAHAEAVAHLTAALKLLQTLPDDAERIPRELQLQMALAPELIAIKGWGSSEMVGAYTRARELCRRLGDPPEIFPVLCGVCAMHYVLGELQTSKALAEELLQMAQGTGDPAQFRWAHASLALSLFNRGDLLLAKEHNDAAIGFYDRARDERLRYNGISPGVVGLSYRSWILWHLGYPDQALDAVNQACMLAQEVGHPDSIAFALGYACNIHWGHREVELLRELATRNSALCAEHGITTFGAAANYYLGSVIVAQGLGEDGIALIRKGLAAQLAAGFGMLRPKNLSILADACLTAGRFDEGLQAVSEALAAAEPHEEHLSTADLHRLRGQLLLKQDPSRIGEAQRCFEQAIEVARSQSAKSFELRATTSLARLLRDTNRRDEARTMLGEIYDWFTEGFDTADLKDAKALLDELTAQPAK